MNKNWFLYIALVIPLAMFGVTAIGVLYPQAEAVPQEDFIYMAAGHYGAYHCAQDAKAKLLPADKEINPAHVPTKVDDCADANLYIYHFRDKSNTKISLADAKLLKLSAKSESSDGYKIEPYCSSTMYFMWPFDMGSHYHYDICISKDSYQKKINIPIQENKYNSFQFIAWIHAPTTTQK
jgi:hypothetical protein